MVKHLIDITECCIQSFFVCLTCQKHIKPQELTQILGERDKECDIVVREKLYFVHIHVYRSIFRQIYIIYL